MLIYICMLWLRDLLTILEYVYKSESELSKRYKSYQTSAITNSIQDNTYAYMYNYIDSYVQHVKYSKCLMLFLIYIVGNYMQ